MEPPSHPDLDDSAHDSGGSNLAGKLVVGALITLVAVVVLLHLTGVVGPGAH